MCVCFIFNTQHIHFSSLLCSSIWLLWGIKLSACYAEPGGELVFRFFKGFVDVCWLKLVNTYNCFRKLIKGKPKWRHKLAWGCRKYALIFILRSHTAVLSVFVLMFFFPPLEFELLEAPPCWFTLYQWRPEKVGLWRILYFCHTFRPCSHDIIDTFAPHFGPVYMTSLTLLPPCSWRHWHRPLGTKWQHSWSQFWLSNAIFYQTGWEIKWKTKSVSYLQLSLCTLYITRMPCFFDRLMIAYRAQFFTLKQTHCARTWFYMSD